MYKIKIMFSSGQLVFALIFLITFIVLLFISYKKDLKLHKQYYKGSLWILFFFIFFIFMLFIIKNSLKK